MRMPSHSCACSQVVQLKNRFSISHEGKRNRIFRKVPILFRKVKTFCIYGCILMSKSTQIYEMIMKNSPIFQNLATIRKRYWEGFLTESRTLVLFLHIPISCIEYQFGDPAQSIEINSHYIVHYSHFAKLAYLPQRHSQLLFQLIRSSVPSECLILWRSAR